MEKQNNNLILFYGFSGRLANKYSVIQDMSFEKLNASVNILNISEAMKDVNMVIYTEEEFIDRMGGYFEDVQQISFEEATIILRTTLSENEKKEEIPFEEAEEDEMDENCIVGCSPAEHVCGK